MAESASRNRSNLGYPRPSECIEPDHGTNKGLKYDMGPLSDCCEVLARLLNKFAPEIKSISKFSYESTKMTQDLEDITQLLSEFNGKNATRQGAARKETHSQIAKLSRDFSDHLGLFTTTCQEDVSKLQEVNMDKVRDKMNALYNQAREQARLSNVNQVEDSEPQQHLKGVTGQGPEKPFLLKGQISYHETIAIDYGYHFDVYRGQMIDGETVAIKQYCGSVLSDRRGLDLLKHLMRQVALWRSFHHPSVLPYYGVGMQVMQLHEDRPPPRPVLFSIAFYVPWQCCKLISFLSR
ncbi:hypothetical protein FRC10_001435 [Ceratobasidium sp. 414]|nr:hypothetical protein FRC10_001435 [Ceratobasidium sp. 414]